MQPEDSLSPPSSAVLEAQKRLWQLRDGLGIVPQKERKPFVTAAPEQEPNWQLRNAQKALQHMRLSSGITGSCAVEPAKTIQYQGGGNKPESDPLPPAVTSQPAAKVTVHPTMALAILRQNREAPARMYYLLRAIDGEGRGWLTIEDIRRQLTAKEAPLRICGWRRLRQLLHEGEGIFWRRDDRDRLWLNGAHKIAYKLDCERLQGYPIDLPVQALLGGIQAVRAAFYAAFHSGRDSQPISRETLESLSGIPSRTQLEYDRVAGVQRTRNIAIGERYSQDSIQERAWRHGRAAFHFVDTEGRQGRAGREYVAWHLPNNYRADYRRRSRGSRKRLNRKLADLVKKGIPGNDDRAVEKLFFANGALAARRYNRDPEIDAYWQQEQSTRMGDRLWWVVAGIRR